MDFCFTFHSKLIICQKHSLQQSNASHSIYQLKTEARSRPQMNNQQNCVIIAFARAHSVKLQWCILSDLPLAILCMHSHSSSLILLLLLLLCFFLFCLLFYIFFFNLDSHFFSFCCCLPSVILFYIFCV